MIDTAASLRDMLEKRRTKSKTEGLLRLPFLLDEDLADRVEDLAKQVAAMEDRRDAIVDAEAELDDDPERDVRASGHDLSPSAVEAAEVETEIARLRGLLQVAVDEADAARVWLLFRRATADEYEQLLRKHGGGSVQGGSDEERAFLNALTARCFIAAEMPDGSRDPMPWEEFVTAGELSMGELAPIRAMVFAHNARGGNSVPFSSASSGRTRTS